MVDIILKSYRLPEEYRVTILKFLKLSDQYGCHSPEFPLKSMESQLSSPIDTLIRIK